MVDVFFQNYKKTGVVLSSTKKVTSVFLGFNFDMFYRSVTLEEFKKIEFIWYSISMFYIFFSVPREQL